MKDCCHEFVIVEERGIGIHSSRNDKPSYTVRAYKQCVVDNLHKLSRMTFNSPKLFKTVDSLLSFIIGLGVVNLWKHQSQSLGVLLWVTSIAHS